MSQVWQGFPHTSPTPLITLLFPESDADTTGEPIEDALARRMLSISGRYGPPSTN